MEKIKIDKHDVIWSYLAQFLQLASGILILPIVLRLLPAEEIGLNYLMLNIGAMVALLDFGFAPQFGRNISYIYGGAQMLLKEGVQSSIGETINYRLLATMIEVARRVYKYMSIITLLLMLSFGSIYMYFITEGFKSVHNSWLIWLVYCLSTYFSVYFVYYESLLLGAGQVKECKIAVIASKLCNVILSILFLYSGLSLLGICLANLIAPFVSRYICKYFYFTDELKNKILAYKISNEEIKELFITIWYNAKKLGLNFLATYAISKMGLFLAGLYLSLECVSSYGLLIQLVTLLGTVSMMPFTTIQPKLSCYRVEGCNVKLISSFATSMLMFYILFFVGGMVLIYIAPWFLDIIGSNSVLPSKDIAILYLLVMFLEFNHSSFATLILTSNNVPFVKPSIFSGIAIVVCSYVSLQFLNIGLLGLVISQGLCQLIYNNWKWPKVILDEFNISIPDFLRKGFIGLINVAKC